VTALHRAFNIKGLGLQPHLSGPIDAKGFSGALTNLGGGTSTLQLDWQKSPLTRTAVPVTGNAGTAVGELKRGLDDNSGTRYARLAPLDRSVSRRWEVEY